MKIVVLDGQMMNPGDLSWDALRMLGECDIHSRTLPDQVVSRAAGAEAVLTNKVVLNEAVLSQLPALRYIGVTATGYNVVDVGVAAKRGITTTNVPGYSGLSVAQHTFALLLELTNRVGAHAAAVQDGAWVRSPDFCFWNGSLMELKGLTLGIIGSGDIGRAVARIGVAFGMRVLLHSRHPPVQVPEGVEWVGSRDQVLCEADVLTLHCPLTSETQHLINTNSLAQMKPTAYLINTARGGLVDEAALAEALREGRIAGAAVDVLSSEPPMADNPLLSAPNCVITPHLAWATLAARQRLMREVVENLAAFQQGTPRNIVSVQR